jgi:hypothetical protein
LIEEFHVLDQVLFLFENIQVFAADDKTPDVAAFKQCRE